MQLLIAEPVSKEISWWLYRINVEWSGVAYYRISKYDENKYPAMVELVYFHVLDIGDSSETEWSAEVISKAQNIFLRNKTISKKIEGCFQGLIHSHHTMACGFSVTDKKNLIEHAPVSNFYFSLIVSLDNDKSRGFAISYIDNYGFPHAFELPEKDILESKYALKPLPDWEKQLDTITKRKEIEKKAKTTIKTLSNYDNYVPFGEGIKEEYQLAAFPYEHNDCDIKNIDIKGIEINESFDTFAKNSDSSFSSLFYE